MQSKISDTYVRLIPGCTYQIARLKQPCQYPHTGIMEGPPRLTRPRLAANALPRRSGIERADRFHGIKSLRHLYICNIYVYRDRKVTIDEIVHYSIGIIVVYLLGIKHWDAKVIEKDAS